MPVVRKVAINQAGCDVGRDAGCVTRDGRPDIEEAIGTQEYDASIIHSEELSVSPSLEGYSHPSPREGRSQKTGFLLFLSLCRSRPASIRADVMCLLFSYSGVWGLLFLILGGVWGHVFLTLVECLLVSYSGVWGLLFLVLILRRMGASLSGHHTEAYGGLSLIDQREMMNKIRVEQNILSSRPCMMLVVDA